MLTRISFVQLILFISLTGIMHSSLFGAERQLPLTNGQNIYVPAYPDVYSQGMGRRLQLTVTLSIRNIDPSHEIEITKVDYYFSSGTPLKKHLEKPISLKPMDAVSYIAPRRDPVGEEGANFIVSWKSETPVNPPIIESIMTGVWGSQAIGFVGRGVEIFPTN